MVQPRERRSRFVVAVASILLFACGEGPAVRDPVIVEPPADGRCTDLTRTVAKWQGREISICGTETIRFRALTPLGNGFIFGWTPGTGNSELWQLAADNTLGTGPLAAYYSAFNRNNLVLVVLGERMLAYSQKTGEVDVFQINPTVRGVDDILRPNTPAAFKTQNWFRPGGGRELVALDPTNLLDWQPSTGSYSLVRFRPTDENSPFERSEIMGKKDAFRRGHRVMALGAGRILEWVPRTHEYRIWHYSLERAPGDIFDAEPVVRGS